MALNTQKLRRRGAAALCALALAGGVAAAGTSAAMAAPVEDEITIAVPVETIDSAAITSTDWQVRYKNDNVPYLNRGEFEAKCPASHPWLMMNKPGTLDRNDLAPGRENPGGVQIIDHPVRTEVSTYEHPTWRQEMEGVGPDGKWGKYYAVNGVKGDFLRWTVSPNAAFAVYLQCTNDPFKGGAVKPAQQWHGGPTA